MLEDRFCDKGPSYRSAIFVQGENQQELAIASKIVVQNMFEDRNVVTEILPTSKFWPVEEYHPGLL